ncbi:MAG: hypothetical protein Q9190_003856 [Brigantiaea leucoxantha]
MTSDPKVRLQPLTSRTFTPSETPNSPSEILPKIGTVAPSSTSPRLRGKVAIITGANSPLGIGRATAHQYVQNGVRALYICDAISTHLPAIADELRSLSPASTATEIRWQKIDAADENDVKRLIEDAVTRYGRLDIFFANAGIVGTNVGFADISNDAFMEVLRVNVLSVFLAFKYASKAMLLTSAAKPTPQGSLLATASVAGLRSNAGGTEYSASKAAVVSLVQTTCYQLAGTNIRCNAICPGLIETGMTSMMYEAARKRGTEAKIGQLNPMQRGAVADEVARVALFLASEEASYVNGQAWAVDGGLSAGHPVVKGKLA